MPGPARIESAEIVSFQLEVPLAALERVPDMLSTAAVRVEKEGQRRVVTVTAGQSQLRFRPAASRAVLTDVRLEADEGGLFFQRVLGPLMVEHQGSLFARLTWDVPERNSHGRFAEVRIQKGVTTYPGLVLLKNVMAPHVVAMADEGVTPFEGDASSSGEGPQGDPPESLIRELRAEKEEVDRLLEDARRFFAEYQRLKTRPKPVVD